MIWEPFIPKIMRYDWLFSRAFRSTWHSNILRFLAQETRFKIKYISLIAMMKRQMVLKAKA